MPSTKGPQSWLGSIRKRKTKNAATAAAADAATGTTAPPETLAAPEASTLMKKLRDRDAMQRAKDEKAKASQAAAEELAKRLGCASDWLPEYLEWLGVDFDTSNEHDTLTFLKSKGIMRAWADEHDKSNHISPQCSDVSVIKDCTAQLSAYEVGDLTEAVESIKVSEHAPDFTATFRTLCHIVSPDPSKTASAKQQVKKPAKAPKARRFVEINSPHLSMSLKWIRSLSSDDTDFTTSSKDEAYSEELKAAFLGEITQALGSQFNMEKWRDIPVRLEYLYRLHN